MLSSASYHSGLSNHSGGGGVQVNRLFSINRVRIYGLVLGISAGSLNPHLFRLFTFDRRQQSSGLSNSHNVLLPLHIDFDQLEDE